MYSELLVPVDHGVKSNKVALQEAAEIASESDGRVHLLFVYPVYAPDPTGSFEDQTGTPTAITHAIDFLDEYDIDVLATTVTGTTVDEICAYAAENDIDAISMATYGRTGFQRLAFGSTTEDTIRQAPCPVIAVTDDQ